MEHVLFILTILSKLLEVLILLLLGVFLFALAAPVRLKFSGAGSFGGWKAFLEDTLEDAGPGVRSEGYFQAQASILGGLIQASVMGGSGGEKDSGTPGGGIETRLRLLRLFSVDARKPPGKHPDRLSKTTDAAKPAGEKEDEPGWKRGRTPRAPWRRRLGEFSKIPETFGKEEFRAEIIRSLKALHRALHLKVRAEADFGLGDPGTTGMVYGIAQSFMGSFGITALTLTPNFEEDVLRGKASMEARFIPGAVLFILVRTILSKPVRPLWWKRKRTRKGTVPCLLPM
ncbi:MAG TPA: DUF2953 domain-containing protein [Firmicutes bacterium]|nr:DUF2953 domain-containing protein [Candidatus Fermentithermobacillaceae bacterium]